MKERISLPERGQKIPQSSVARIESGKTTPNLGTLIKIFQRLGLQLNVSRSTPTV
ncbi:MAG: helix-turn-helix transcriptional regulator [Eubacterium sp.]|nr:helix-turn-helix transcriptional regulator [Eubacterium sp.]